MPPKKKQVPADQSAKEKDLSQATEEKDLISIEIASEDSRIYKSYQFTDYNPDDLVGKKGLKIYRTMAKDEQVKACMQIKRLARLSTKWEIKPGDENNAKSVEMAKFCTYVLRNIKASVGQEIQKAGEPDTISSKTLTWRAGSFKSVLYKIMSAMQYGFSLTEKIWAYYDDGPYKGKLGLAALKTKEPFYYDFDTDKYGNIIGIRPPGLTLSGTTSTKSPDGQGVLPAWKFVIYSYQQEFSNWYGTSDLRSAYRCFSGDTQLLTEDGWKLCGEIKLTDRVATLNPKTNEVEYHLPDRIFHYARTGKMFHQGGRFIDLMVTPNHRMWVCNQHSSKWYFVEADKMPRRVRMKRDGVWAGKHIKDFVIPEMKTSQGRILPEKKIPMHAWLRLLGVYLAEGSTDKGYYVQISQNPGKDCDKIIQWVKDCGYKPYIKGPYKNQSACHIIISSKQLVEYLAKLGKSYDKYIPREMMELSPQLLRYLFDGLMLGDGRHETIGKLSGDYCTVSERLADDVQELIFKMGYASTKKYCDSESRFGKGKVWIVGINSRGIADTLCNEHEDQRRYVDYDGEVHCVEVKNHLVYARRNGKCCWSGNSWWSKDMTIKWMNIYLERYGMPTVVIQYPNKGRVKKEVLDDIDDILQNLQAKGGFRIPDNFKAEFLEAKRAGEAGYIKAIEAHDKAISRAILIPNKLGFGEDENGSYALGKKQFDIFLSVLEDIGNDLSDTVVDDQIIKPLIMYNYGEVDDELMPYFQFESLIGDDPLPKATVLKTLRDAGFVDPREDWVREWLNLPNRDLVQFPHSTPVGEPMVPMVPNQGQNGNEDDPNNPDDGPDGGGDKPPVKPGKKPMHSCGHVHKFQLSRKPNAFEKKVDFARLAKNVDLLSTGMLESLRSMMRDTKADLIKQVQKHFDNGDAREGIKSLNLKGMKNFTNTLRDWLIKTHLDTKLGALEELAKTDSFDIEIKRRFDAMPFDERQIPFEPWNPLPPTEAIDFFNRKVLAKVGVKDASKVLITLATGKELKFYTDRAFYIAGVEQKYILDTAKNVLLTGLEKGWANQKMMGSLNDLFDKYLASGELRDGELVTANRLETIVRTNTTEAYNRGRISMFENPVVKDEIPYVQWSSIIDDRTTEYCATMDQQIFRNGEVEAPPAHFNCRSVMVPITQDEVDQDPSAIDVTTQAEVEKSVPRAAGFRMEVASNPDVWSYEIGPSFCLYSTCHEPGPKMVKETPVLKEFVCQKCQLPMRVTKTGDQYLFDVGTEMWIRMTRGWWPTYFQEKEK